MISSTRGINLNTDQFLKLFLTQLQNQNPLDPLNDRELVAQLAQLSTVEGMEKLNANFSSMLHLQRLSEGSNLIGRTVVYNKSQGDGTERGVVGSVIVDQGEVKLKIGDKTIALAQVRSIEPNPK